MGADVLHLQLGVLGEMEGLGLQIIEEQRNLICKHCVLFVPALSIWQLLVAVVLTHRAMIS